jgi:peptidoglycan/xylan/chitin deacetylase (PgdA/CDA1 family)
MLRINKHIREKPMMKRKIRYTYPKGLRKALTFSYDDGETGDRRLVGLFNEYGLKGTFHLNDGKFDTGNYISASEVRELYKTQEVACHGVWHKHPCIMSTDEARIEYIDNRAALEKLTGTMVRGLSYAYGEYSDEIIDVARACGIVYSRTVQSTYGFQIPADFMKWHPTIWHGDERLNEMIDNFLNVPDYMELPLLYIWGHSFEFDRNDNWEIIEEAAKRLAHHGDRWYATNMEIYEYIRAVRSLVYSADGKSIYNPSAVTVWAEDPDSGTYNLRELYEIGPGQTVGI